MTYPVLPFMDGARRGLKMTRRGSSMSTVGVAVVVSLYRLRVLGWPTSSSNPIWTEGRGRPWSGAMAGCDASARAARSRCCMGRKRLQRRCDPEPESKRRKRRWPFAALGVVEHPVACPSIRLCPLPVNCVCNTPYTQSRAVLASGLRLPFPRRLRARILILGDSFTTPVVLL